MRAPSDVCREALTFTSAARSSRTRIQSPEPGRTTPLTSGPAKLPSATYQLIRSPSGTRPIGCSRRDVLSEARNFVSQPQHGSPVGGPLDGFSVGAEALFAAARPI